MSIVFIEPSYDYENEIMAVCKEYQSIGKYIHGSGGLTQHKTFESWIDRVSRMNSGKQIRNTDVQTHTYLVIDEDTRVLIGFVSIRPLLNRELLRRGGNITFTVFDRLSNNGYATEVLTKALSMCKEWGLSKVRLTCHTSNLAATRVITKCGGILDSTEFFVDDNAEISKYWINIE